MSRRKAPKKTTAAEVFEQILNRVKTTGSLGASWHQGPYKYDFFRIFDNAWCNGLCGQRSWDRYNKLKKSPPIESRIVQPENIRSYLREHLTADEFKSLSTKIKDFLGWWEEWTYAWDCHPNPPPRPYERKANKHDGEIV